MIIIRCTYNKGMYGITWKKKLGKKSKNLPCKVYQRAALRTSRCHRCHCGCGVVAAVIKEPAAPTVTLPWPLRARPCNRTRMARWCQWHGGRARVPWRLLRGQRSENYLTRCSFDLFDVPAVCAYVCSDRREASFPGCSSSLTRVVPLSWARHRKFERRR